MVYYPPKPTRGWPGSELHQRLIADPRWIVEPKLKGDRCLVAVTREGIELWSRHGRKFDQPWLQPLVDALAGLGLPDGTILDSELIKPKPNATVWVFDVPRYQAQDTGQLVKRRAIMENLVRPVRGRIEIVQTLAKKTAYEVALKQGHEGVVWKRLDSYYQWQMSPDESKVPHWIKMKPVGQ